MADEMVRYNITSVRRQFCQNSVAIASPQRSLSQSQIVNERYRLISRN